MTVLRRGVIGDEVPARGIVDEAVGVVIHAVAGGLARVAGDLADQVLMVRGDPGVDHRDRHAGAEAAVHASGASMADSPHSEGKDGSLVAAAGVHRAVGLGVDDVVVGAELRRAPRRTSPSLGLTTSVRSIPSSATSFTPASRRSSRTSLRSQAGLALDDDVAFGGLGSRRGEERRRAAATRANRERRIQIRVSAAVRRFLERATDHSYRY